jgi:hypothetical protein
MNIKFLTRRLSLQIRALLIIAFVFSSSLIAKAETSRNAWPTLNSSAPTAQTPKTINEVHVLHGAMYLLIAGILYFGVKASIDMLSSHKSLAGQDNQEPRKRSIL